MNKERTMNHKTETTVINVPEGMRVNADGHFVPETAIREQDLLRDQVVMGLVPIMYGDGTGSEVMQRIATPMIGGMVSAIILTLLILPAVYFQWKKIALRKEFNRD